MASDVTRSATWEQNSLVMAASLTNGMPASFMRAALYTISRAASISVAICAIWNWIPWKSAIAFPNCLRSWAYFAAYSQAPRATPAICAPIPMRPSFKVSMAILYPLPTSPRTFDLGTRQSSRINSQVEEARMPSLSSFLPTVNPGNSFSIIKAVMPLYPAAGSTVANRIKTPASLPLVIHNLRPLRT